jgi:hypothetical protein
MSDFSLAYRVGNNMIPGRLWRRLAYLRHGMRRKYPVSMDQGEQPDMSPFITGFYDGGIGKYFTDRQAWLWESEQSVKQHYHIMICTCFRTTGDCAG